MKVRELIALLQAMPQEADVFIHQMAEDNWESTAYIVDEVLRPDHRYVLSLGKEGVLLK